MTENTAVGPKMRASAAGALGVKGKSINRLPYFTRRDPVANSHTHSVYVKLQQQQGRQPLWCIAPAREVANSFAKNVGAFEVRAGLLASLLPFTRVVPFLLSALLPASPAHSLQRLRFVS